MIEIPHFSFPFKFDPVNGVAVVEQDTIEDVMSCEMVIASCPTGFRDDRPEFGWDWPELASVPLNLTALESALSEWEPRGKPDATELYDIASSTLTSTVAVQIQSIQGA